MNPPRAVQKSRSKRAPRKTSTVKFTKVEATGNDFVLFDLLDQEMNPVFLARAETVRRICSRRTGIGADGVLLLLSGNKHQYRMRIFNADGSEAEMCGNGFRGLVHYLHSRAMTPGDTVPIETPAGVKTALIGNRMISLDLGRPQVVPGAPFTVENQAFDAFTLSVGNPHAVIFVDDVGNYPVERYGPAVEHHPRFPNRTNVEFVEVIGPADLKARVWERGVGETLSCGTGAGAVLFAAFSTGRSKRKARVRLPGGVLTVEFRRDGILYLSGPARIVYQGKITL